MSAVMYSVANVAKRVMPRLVPVAVYTLRQPGWKGVYVVGVGCGRESNLCADGIGVFQPMPRGPSDYMRDGPV